MEPFTACGAGGVRIMMITGVYTSRIYRGDEFWTTRRAVMVQCGLNVPTSCYSFRHLFYSSLILYFKLDFAFKTDETSGVASQAAGASVQIFWAVRCARPIGCSYLVESGVKQQYFTPASACGDLTLPSTGGALALSAAAALTFPQIAA